jgi:TPR repeat protein
MGMYGVGICYQYGTEVSRDLRKAKEWFTKAAAQRNEHAQTQLDLLNAA